MLNVCNLCKLPVFLVQIQVQMIILIRESSKKTVLKKKISSKLSMICMFTRQVIKIDYSSFLPELQSVSLLQAQIKSNDTASSTTR